MATPQNIFSTYSAESRDAHPRRLNNTPKDQDSKHKSLDGYINFPRESSSSVDKITKNKSGPERHSSTNNLNKDTCNAVKENLDNEEMKNVTEEPEENDEKMNKIMYQNKMLHNQLKKAKGEYMKKLNAKDGQINELLNHLKKAKGEYEKKLNAKDGQINELQNGMEEAKGEYQKKVKELRKKNHVFMGIAIIVGVVAVLTALNLDFKGHEKNRHELRLMLVGKTGAGKSATGNTILGENSFRVEASPASVTGNCEKRNKFITGRNITIIDTPGVMDTWLTSEQTAHNAPQCISSYRPGPHVFLLVIRLGRFTQEEINAVKWIQENFGEEALRFTLILFTGGDLLEGKPVEKFISNSYELQSLVDTCQGRYHVFNNYNQSNRTQVTQLFEKIDQILHENMGYIYSLELNQYLKQNIQKEEERKRMILERQITECNSLREKNRQKEEDKRKELEEELKIQMNETSSRQQEEIMILEKETNQCKSLLSEITEKEAIKRKELEEEFKKDKVWKINEKAKKLEGELFQTVNLKDLSFSRGRRIA